MGVVRLPCIIKILTFLVAFLDHRTLHYILCRVNRSEHQIPPVGCDKVVVIDKRDPKYPLFSDSEFYGA